MIHKLTTVKYKLSFAKSLARIIGGLAVLAMEWFIYNHFQVRFTSLSLPEFSYLEFLGLHILLGGFLKYFQSFTIEHKL